MKMNPIELKKAFSERLYNEFQRIGLPMNSPTEIARLANRKLPQLSVTPQTIRKWLFHGVYPSQDKIIMLADWLGVSAQWLRFGEGDKFTQDKVFQLSADYRVSANLLLLSFEYERLIPIVDSLAKLSSRDLALVEGLVLQMLAKG